MASFDNALPHFTNQLAYQSIFAPPGFSFESPFSYPQSASSSNDSGTAAGVMQQHQYQAPASHDMGMEMDSGTNGQASMQAESSAMAAMQAGAGMWKSAWPAAVDGGKPESPSLHSLFPSPAIRLNTGDRFSQLLEEKLGMDQRNTSTAYNTSGPGRGPTSAPPQQSNHQIAQPLSYPNYMSSPIQPQQSPYPPFVSTSNSQNWDHLAIESNLQDYNQVQIQPDLVAPMPPSSYFHLGGISGTDYVGGVSMPVASGSRPQARAQTQSQAVYPAYTSTDSYQNAAMSAPPFPVQASPHSISSRSSPSNHPSQINTPQSALQPIPIPADMHWPTTASYASLPAPPPPSSSLPRHAQSQPLLRHASADTTPYTSFQRIRLDTQSTASPNPATVPAPIMGGTPQSQSFPGANGSWARDMVGPTPSSASLPLSSASASLQHFSAYSQPLSRSSSQHTWASTPILDAQYPQFEGIRPLPDGIPSSFPPAPQLSKRSRSPQSQKSSPHDSHSLVENKEGPKRPKLSMPMNIAHSAPASGSQGHSDEDAEKKVIIACHTCRARKLKCDGARPKCHHCSRRKEDSCVYDAVLRRRGPGKKNKKGKSDGGKDELQSASPTDELVSASAANRHYGSRFEVSTERS